MYNKVMLIGNLGQDVTLTTTQAGKSVGKFSLAVKDGDKTEWVNIVTWEKTADNCSNYIGKGSKVFVEGRIQTDTWDKDGVKQYKTNVVASRVVFLDSKKDGQAQPQTSELEDIPFDESDLPF